MPRYRSASLAGTVLLLAARTPALAPLAAVLAAPCGVEVTNPSAGFPDWTADEAWMALDEGTSIDIQRIKAWAQERLAEAQSAHGPDSLEAAAASDIVVKVACLESQERCQDESTKSLAARALATKESHLGLDAIELLPSLINLASAEHSIAEQGQFLERAVAIVGKHWDPGNYHLLPALRQLSNHHGTWGSAARAVELKEKVLELRVSALGPDHPKTLETLVELGRAAWMAGDLDRASAYAERAVTGIARTLGQQTRLYGDSLNLQGILWAEEGLYVRARRRHEEALEVRQRLAPPGPSDLGSDVGNSYNNLGDIDLRLLDFKAARGEFERAVQLWRANRSPNDPEVALALTNLGTVLTEMGETAAAREKFTEALDILDRQGGSQRLAYYASALIGLAGVSLRAGETEAARPLLEQALGLREERFGPAHPGVADVLALLATIDDAAGERLTARERLERSLWIRRSALGTDHPDVAGNLQALASLRAKEGAWSEALQLALQGAAVAHRSLRLTARGLPERQALRYGAQAASALGTLLELATHAADQPRWRDVLDEVVRSRAVVLDEMGRRHGSAARSTDPETARLSGELERVRVRLASLILTEPEHEGYRDKVEALRGQKETLERRLGDRVASFREEHRLTEVGLDEVQKALPAGAVLVSYVEYGSLDATYGAFVLRRDGDPRFVALGPAAQIDERIETWRSEASTRPAGPLARIREAERRYREVAEVLRESIWDPLATAVGDAAQILIVPDSNLNIVNFATLPTGDRGYLVEKEPTFQYVSAERDLVGGRPGQASVNSLMAVGGPNYDSSPGGATAAAAGDSATSEAGSLYRGATSTCGDFRSLRFGPLPLAAAEAKDIALMWRKSVRGNIRLLTGPEATETAFKLEAPHYTALHVATHGFLLASSCVDPSPQSTTPRKGRSSGEFGLEENPLLRSGLVFAGANRREEANATPGDDGILTAEEIASLDLSRVRWVVLSACGTGLGPIEKGEGILGLRRAFRIAGAETLVVSLWDVSDEGTRNWMHDLYDRRLGEMATWTGVRDTARRMLEAQRKSRDHGHPFVWGAFVASGWWP